MNQTDEELRKFTRLQVLVLSGNNLRGVEGSFLPRRLKFLELYDNFINDITTLVETTPKYLSHLGLGRNKLDDNSSLHLLAKSGNFLHLRSLDLSDNDIYDLLAILNKIKELPSLKSLQLEGNPCYLDGHYKLKTIHHIPKLLFLDNVEISRADRSVSETSLGDKDTKPQMIFYCHRIMGLRPPPKDKKNLQTIHLEIKLPLLERIVSSSENTENIIDNSHNQAVKKPSKNQKNADGKGSRKEKNSSKTSPYDKPDEFDPQLDKYNVSFKTEKLPWNNVMKFLPICIESPEGNDVLIRDTLRTCVKVNVVYIKAAHQSKAKGKKGNKAGEVKHTNKKTKTIESAPEKDIPKETILKRVTLYSFFCNLQSVNWNDESIDYLWMDHPKFGEDGLKMKCLKNLVYGEKSKKGKKKVNKDADSRNTQGTGATMSVPKIFTCHVGFGLKRS
ncbi:unnamed protein product [Phaedon cochleariae]|uniref:Dynein axonemal assembly factor 1 homolog n=1 Tax=Phaedon cochleariae TaxID=80249 RepID=A0A9P0DE40_PHACE|nr:unnamed protein product [Phaedon cochleariae]